MLPAARPLPCPTTTVDRILGVGLWIVNGWSFSETTGIAGAHLELYDGRNADSTLFATVTLAKGESTRDLTGEGGLACHVGIYVHVVAGSVKGSVWAVPGIDHDGIVLARGVRPVWAGAE